MDLETVGAAPDVEVVARLIAADEREWLRRPERVVCWLAVRMQMAAGLPQRDAALMFDISLSAISLRSPKWKDDGCESDLPRIAEVVRRAIVLRRELTGDRTSDAGNDKRWCTLPEAKPALSAGDMLFGVAQKRGKKRATAEAEACFRDEWQRSEVKRLGYEARVRALASRVWRGRRARMRRSCRRAARGVCG